MNSIINKQVKAKLLLFACLLIALCLPNTTWAIGEPSYISEKAGKGFFQLSLGAKQALW